MDVKYNKPSVYTILFTEDCPVVCRYCDMRAQPLYKNGYCMQEEEFFEKVDKLLASHTAPNPVRLLFTGGEPFTKWKWIKQVFEKYGNTIQYAFNTNGYLLTKDIIKFLSNYHVTWTLSVDGDEQISKWQRPTANNQYDYWEKVTKIFPTLLYYFPNIAWKSVLSQRLIPFVHRIWSSAEKLGFRIINFVPDFADQPRPYDQLDGSQCIEVKGRIWQEKDFKQLQEQFNLIAQDFAAGLCAGKIRTLEYEMHNILFSILKDNSEPDIACGVQVGRKNITLLGDMDYTDCCLQGIECNRDKTTKEIFDNIEFPDKCPIDKDCLFWNNCQQNGCIKDNFEENGDYFTKAALACKLSMVAGNAVISILSFMNGFDSSFYPEFLNMIKERRDFPWLTIPRA